MGSAPVRELRLGQEPSYVLVIQVSAEQFLKWIQVRAPVSVVAVVLGMAWYLPGYPLAL